ncbi:DUF2892 domain-containing protein [Halorussus halobius]|uniref:DUF2892 domain-containing protein n=1 Tax=Halorussus halobius TaxID=1710537 RepID=UPI00109336ED|nr:DUF2892 domain-containing protein [Halorussus halobius]
MDFDTDVSSRGTLARVLVAAFLGVAAIRWLWSGKRARGALAGVGALALGYAATSESPEPAEAVDLGGADESADSTDDGVGATDEDAELRCAACGEPIQLGESRGPNESGEIVHDACR